MSHDESLDSENRMLHGHDSQSTTMASLEAQNNDNFFASSSQQEHVQTSLLSLPDEVLMKIFYSFDAYFIERTLVTVCKRFAKIFCDDILWKRLLTRSVARYMGSRKFSLQHPVNAGLKEDRWWCSRDLLWQHQAVQFHRLESQWKNDAGNIFERSFGEPHYSAIDAVKLHGSHGNILITGGRDRFINVWAIGMEDLAVPVTSLHTVSNSHEGWVWDLDSCSDETFYSCGWDNKVVHWDLTTSLTKLNSFNCHNPVTAISCVRGLVAAAVSLPRIVLIDPRIGQVNQIPPQATRTFNMHRHSLTDILIVPERNLVLSISEDKTLQFLDLRQQGAARKLVKISRDNSFPNCMSLYRNTVYIGDSRGNVHFYSLDSGDIQADPINIGPSARLITGVVPNSVGITVGSTDGFVRLMYPTNPPVVLWAQLLSGEVTSLDQDRNVLAISTSSSKVVIFSPVKR